MNNPLSSDPRHALYPHPVGCTGWRIWQMLRSRTGATRDQYLETFDRRNLLCARSWSASEARAAAQQALTELRGCVVVVLGEQTREALGHPRRPHVLPHRDDGGTEWRYLPHPSGRCRWYNDPVSRTMVSLLLEELYMRSAEQ
jgi:hypothetical protein